MSECENHQTQIDQRRHGALERAAAERLEEHLEACVACRDFAAATSTLEERMQGAANAFVEGVNWDQVQTRVRSVQDDYRRALTRMACGWVVLTLVLIALAGTPVSFLDVWAVALRSSLIAAVVVMACSEVGPLYAWFRFREASDAEASADDLLALLRRELDRRMRRIRVGRALSTALAVGGIAAVTWMSSVLSSANDSLWLVIVAPMAALALLPAVVTWRQPLGQLRRERSELG